MLSRTVVNQKVIAAFEGNGLNLRYCLVPRKLGARPSQFNQAFTFQPAVMVVSTNSGKYKNSLMVPVKFAF